jgi:hypothetical protein
MSNAGLTITGLADATRAADPDGKGVSRAALGFLIAQGASAREQINDRAAQLVAAALRKPERALFDADTLAMPQKSTSTRGSRHTMLIEPEAMVDLITLAQLIKRSPSWIYQQIREYPAGSGRPFPVHYAGRSPRFLYRSEVLPWMDAVATERASA